jgi:hypothetical protein
MIGEIKDDIPADELDDDIEDKELVVDDGDEDVEEIDGEDNIGDISREIRRRLDELEEMRRTNEDLDSTFNFNLDDEL